MPSLLLEPILGLFVILVLGSWLGQISVKGISLGSAAEIFRGVGIRSFRLQVAPGGQELGLLLFVYAVGLQAGPRFFRTFRRDASSLVLRDYGGRRRRSGDGGHGENFRFPHALAAGLFTGALTNTPALAAALDAMDRIAALQKVTVSVGYGVAYPFALISIVLLAQSTASAAPRCAHGGGRRLRRRTAARPEKQFQVTNPTATVKP